MASPRSFCQVIGLVLVAWLLRRSLLGVDPVFSSSLPKMTSSDDDDQASTRNSKSQISDRSTPQQTGAVGNQSERSQNEPLIVIQPRVFQAWPLNQTLCFPMPVDELRRPSSFDVDLTPSRRGLLYMKAPKAASTSLASINIRIARNMATRQPNRGASSSFDEGVCDLRFGHGRRGKQMIQPYATRFRNRNPNHSFLWTFLREPSRRLVSQFYYRIRETTDSLAGNDVHREQLFEAFTLGIKPLHFYLCMMSTSGFNCSSAIERAGTMTPHEIDAAFKSLQQHSRRSSSKRLLSLSSASILLMEASSTREAVPREATKILHEQYNFIGIVERLEESLVVLMMLLNLPMADVLNMDIKVSGQSLTVDKKGFCRAMEPTVVTPGMQQLMDAWQESDLLSSDYALYKAANQSLDATIDALLGRARVQAQVERLKHANKVVKQRCNGDTVQVPCTQDKQRPQTETDCYFREMGCGMTCLDQVATDLNLW